MEIDLLQTNIQYTNPVVAYNYDPDCNITQIDHLDNSVNIPF